MSVDRISTLDEARRGAVNMPASVPELEAGLRSRSAGRSEALLPKTTTEDRVSPRRASRRDAISKVMSGYSVVVISDAAQGAR